MIERMNLEKLVESLVIKVLWFCILLILYGQKFEKVVVKKFEEIIG